MFIRGLYTTMRLISQNQALKHHGTEMKQLQHCFFSNKAISVPLMETNPETGEVKKKKSPIIPRITLLSGTDISVSTLEEAQRLAKRRDLKLVKIVDLDTKTQRPVYRLMTGAEYHEEDLRQRERKKEEKQKSSLKGEKVLILSQNISEHDLQTDIKKILKWLAKRYEVRMVINGNSESNKKTEEVYNFLEKHLSPHGRLVQKRQKGTDIKFQVLPPKEPKSSEKSGNQRDNDRGSSQ